VTVRSVENQAVLMQHKVREMLVQQRTQLFNGLRGHLAEVGVIAAQGTCNMRSLGALVREAGYGDTRVTVTRAITPKLLHKPLYGPPSSSRHSWHPASRDPAVQPA
jgi:transposase